MNALFLNFSDTPERACAQCDSLLCLCHLHDISRSSEISLVAYSLANRIVLISCFFFYFTANFRVA